MRRFFGTDGIRGVAGRPPLDPDTLGRLGRALVADLRRSGVSEAPRVCLARDTRESCAGIAAALTRGIRAEGGDAADAGVMPTPALALLTREDPFDAGLMISASHNPYHDNGVKVFDRVGSKLTDDAEAGLEALMGELPSPGHGGEGPSDASALSERYFAFLERALGEHRLDGLSVVLDCANGAASRIGPEAFRRAGADVVTIGDRPDGRNINEGVGSLHPEVVAAAVVKHGAHLGFAFDGDADRCIACTGSGRVCDGDGILYYIARALTAAERLPEKKIVGTVMSNLGLEKALGALGIGLERTAVGDRYVLAAMRELGCRLGGEQSGHVILLDHAPTGDGVLTALTISRFVTHGAGPLDEALDAIPRFPQVLLNVRVREKPEIAKHPVLGAAVRDAEARMGGDGRIVVRYSGTEPKARVMIEGADRTAVESLAEELIDVFRREIGEE